MNMRPQPTRIDDIKTMRSTVLGEMHGGQMKMEERHPILKGMTRLAISANVVGMAFLFVSFRIMDRFPPHEMPLMNALGWYFFFGVVYGLFAQMLLSFGRYTENNAIARALTHNRRYEWHSHYDPKALKEEDLKKVAAPPPAPKGPRQPQQTAVGAGAKCFTYSGVFSLFGYFSCGLGLYMFFTTMF